MILKTDTLEEYLENPAYSRSDVWRFFTTDPEACKHAIDNGMNINSEALHYGSAAHKCILEGDEFEVTYAVYDGSRTRSKGPDGNPRPSGKYKAWIDEQGLLLPDGTANEDRIISKTQWQLLRETRTALREHKRFQRMMAPCSFEQSAYWPDPITGLPLKARYDGLSELFDYGIDLKTAGATTARALSNAFAEHGYLFQAAQYLDGMAILRGESPMENWQALDASPSFYYAVVGKESPIRLQLLQVEMGWMQRAGTCYRLALAGLAECHDSGEWPGPPDTIRTLHGPEYSFVPNPIQLIR